MLQKRNMYDRLSEYRIRGEKLKEQERLAQEALNKPPPPPERFQTNELCFVRPGTLKDKTFHVFTLTDIGASPFSFVVGRTVIEGGADLEGMALQLLGELGKTLSHLEWIEPLHPTQLAGVEARQVEFKWRQQGQPVHQLQLIFFHQDEHGQPLLMQLTGTSNGARGMTADERAAFFSIVDTLELRELPDPEKSGGEAQSV